VERIVIMRAGALGDVVLALPAVRAIRETNPNAHIEVVGYPAFWEIAGALVDGIRSIDGPLFSTLYARSPAPALRAWLAGADRVIAWTVHDPGADLLALGVPVLHASPYPPPGIHAAEWLLQTLGLHADSHTPVPLHRQTLEGVRRPTSPIFLHPGAGATWKRWPGERFAEVAGRLSDSGHEVVLVEGPADAAAVVDVQARLYASFPVVREPSIPRLADELAGGALYIGNDSGVTHLAAAAGVPVIALFGPTDPLCWAPLGAVEVLRACSRRAIEQGQIRVCDDPDCMAEISVESVLAATAPWVGRV
jgi:heptosyltransferase-3